MTIPQWVLLAFAAWTILLLISTIGVYRWTLILGGRANIFDFPADIPHGSDWYRRAMRAHANCIENLPVYTALVFLLTILQLDNHLLDYLAITLILARIVQSLIHILCPPTNLAVGLRFCFFFIQIVVMIWMGCYITLINF